jgi:hypothetical protein
MDAGDGVIMQTLPLWIQVLQALGTPVIAVLAIVIGVMQWRTAHQRAVLDLFDKRWTVLNELRDAVFTMMQEGGASRESTRLYAAARDRAAFLFGPEVTEYLKSIHDATGRLYIAGLQLDTNPDDEEAIKQKYNALNVEISKFYERSNQLVIPYMRMHQKAPRFPGFN